jgi:hypothetical protein
MSASPVLGGPELPQNTSEAIERLLRIDERLIWATRPCLTGYAKELLWMYPIYLALACVAGICGWLFYSWLAGMGALWNIRTLGLILVFGVFVVGLTVLPLLWPLHLHRSWYALTTQRLLICSPAIIILWPRIRSVEASEAGNVRVKCIWTWLPDGTGDIYYQDVPLRIMERVSHAEEVSALIRRTLISEPPSPH